MAVRSSRSVLDLVRQIAEALKFAHDKHAIHGALSPQSVLVFAPNSNAPRLKFYNWQTAFRSASTSTSGLPQVTPTVHADVFWGASRSYLAPELVNDPTFHAEHLDVFSLGAIAYHIFSGQAPAASSLELAEKLRRDRGRASGRWRSKRDCGRHFAHIHATVSEIDNLVNPDQFNIAMPTTIEEQISRMHLPSREKEVVSELTRVMRRYADQAPTKLARLMNIAFRVSIGGGASREQKLARAHVRGLEARQQLVEAEGGSWSSEEVARLLQISKTAVLKRLIAGRLLAWREERLQAARFPRWQFDEHGHVLDGLEDVLGILNQDARLDVWGKMIFFLQEKPSLDGRRPLDLLRQGKLKEVKLAAEAYAE